MHKKRSLKSERKSKITMQCIQLVIIIRIAYPFEADFVVLLFFFLLSRFLSLCELLHNFHGFVFPESQHLTNHIHHFGFIIQYHARYSCNHIGNQTKPNQTTTYVCTEYFSKLLHLLWKVKLTTYYMCVCEGTRLQLSLWCRAKITNYLQISEGGHIVRIYLTFFFVAVVVVEWL